MRDCVHEAKGMEIDLALISIFSYKANWNQNPTVKARRVKSLDFREDLL